MVDLRIRGPYKRDCSEVLVSAMIVANALIERDIICRLSTGIYLLKDLYALAFNKIAWQARHTAIKVINNHTDKILESVS